jgi:hypothetical protein
LIAMACALNVTSAAGEERANSVCARSDAVIVSQMSATQIALAALSLRLDLGRCDSHDLETVSGQYELFYREVMSGCAESTAEHADSICPGRSLSENFVDYLLRPGRICRAAAADSCAKPAYTPGRLRDELLELIQLQRKPHDSLAAAAPC